MMHHQQEIVDTIRTMITSEPEWELHFKADTVIALQTRHGP